MAAHTPGPWTVAASHPAGVHDRAVKAGGYFVATVHDTAAHNGCWDADALLIAAAPDLLAELIALTEILESDCDLAPCEGSDAPAEHHLGRAKRIIAQALGTTKDMNDGGPA